MDNKPSVMLVSLSAFSPAFFSLCSIDDADDLSVTFAFSPSVLYNGNLQKRYGAPAIANA